MGQRMVAAIIDFLIIYIYYIVFIYFLDRLDLIEGFQSKGTLTILILVYLPVVLYFPLLEFFLKGRTIGKSLLKLRVTKIDGKPPSIGETILRWLLRAIDIKIYLFFFFLAALFGPLRQEFFQGLIVFFAFVPFPVIGLVAIALSKNNQRVGDIAASTVVIKNRKRISLEETILQTKSEDYEPVFKQALKLRDKDIYIIKKVVEKADQEMDHSQVIPLANKAKKVLDIKSEMLPLHLLKTLLKDYDHLARKKDLEE